VYLKFICSADIRIRRSQPSTKLSMTILNAVNWNRFQHAPSLMTRKQTC